MKKREIKKLAQKIAELEKIIQANEEQEKVKNAQRKITSLCSAIKNPEDFWQLDELIQEALES